MTLRNLREKELEDLRKQWELETDPEKKAELERLMAGKSRELEALKKQAQLTAEHEKRAKEILDKELELADLQRKFGLETDPVRKAELAKQMANKTLRHWTSCLFNWSCSSWFSSAVMIRRSERNFTGLPSPSS